MNSPTRSHLTLLASFKHALMTVPFWISMGWLPASPPQIVEGSYKRPGNSLPTNLKAVGDTLFFTIEDSTGSELWKSDGSATGTVLVKKFNYSNAYMDFQLTIAGGILYFVVDDGLRGRELWKSDGSELGTTIVKDIATGAGISSYPNSLTALGNTLYFSASDSAAGDELWKSDGTVAGTVMVKDIKPGNQPSSPRALTVMNDILYFGAPGNEGSLRLWRSDGTNAGTFLVSDVYFTLLGSDSFNPVVMGNRLFFGGTGIGSSGGKLWKTDGTATGTVLVGGPATQNGSAPNWLTPVGSTIYFVDGTAYYNALWKSNGTPEGTVLVKNIHPYDSRTYPPSRLTAVGNKLFFTSDDAINGTELWISYGTAATTVMVKDLSVGGSSSSPYSLTAMGDTLYFFASVSGYGLSLCKSDGTEAGTVVVKSVYPQYHSDLEIVGDSLYFTAPGTGGSHLWQLYTRGPDFTNPAVTHTFSTSVRVNAPINPLGVTTSAYIEYGLTTSYGAQSALALSPSNGNFLQSLTATLNGLQPGVLYHFRVVASNANGTIKTADQTFTTSTPAAQFNTWTSGANLYGGNAGLSATPHRDGIPNLLKYAFNLRGNGPDSRQLVPGIGSAGLPAIGPSESNGNPVLRFEFLRRIGSGMTYLPQKSSTLNAASWEPLTAVPTVTPVSEEWERVTYHENLETASSLQQFGRVKVIQP